MFLKKVMIKNFRCLRNVEIDLNDTTILIGENNAGKSNILDAIRIALSKVSGKQSFNEYDFYMDGNSRSPKDSEGISIRLIFEERESGEWDESIASTFSSAIQYAENEEKACIILETTAIYDEVSADIKVATTFLNAQYEPIAAKIQNQTNSFLSLTPVFYLQALREIKDTFSAKSPLWGRFIHKVTIPKEELEIIQAQIEQLNNDIISKDSNLEKLVNELQNIQSVMNLDGKDLVSINAVPLKSWDLLSRAQVVLNSGTDNIDFPLERHGQGTKSVTAILLFKAYINILLKELTSEFAEGILTLEEPEAHLHPQAIRALYDSIEEMDSQKIITTHSPYFVQNTDIRNIRVVRKVNGQSSVVSIKDHLTFRVNRITDGLTSFAERFGNVIKPSGDNLITLYESLDKKTERMLRGCCKDITENIEEIIKEAYNIFSEEELHQVNTFVQKSRGDILFAKKWFLYEGQTEEILIPFFAKVMDKAFDAHGINGVMYRQNANAKTIVKLAKVLGIDWVLLGDNDVQGKGSLSEIKNSGYSDVEVREHALLTREKDFEHALAAVPTIFADYESIIKDELSAEEKELQSAGTNEAEAKYREIVVQKIQDANGKVRNAYKLIDIWQQRGLDRNEIPEEIRLLIEKV